jgi:PhzF family phenazine biosynthesis protein
MNIILKNNLSERAFAVKTENGYHLRWFTLGGEIDLCGHATLATAFVIANYYEKNAKMITFQTLSGELTVKNENNLFEMNFPSSQLEKVEVTEEIVAAIGCRPVEVYKGRDLLCILDSEEAVKNVIPDQEKIQQLDGLLLHITAESLMMP